MGVAVGVFSPLDHLLFFCGRLFLAIPLGTLLRLSGRGCECGLQFCCVVVHRVLLLPVLAVVLLVPASPPFVGFFFTVLVVSASLWSAEVCAGMSGVSFPLVHRWLRGRGGWLYSGWVSLG